MRTMRGFAIAAMMLGMSVAAVGQESACTIGVSGFAYYGAGFHHNAPFTATVKHTFEQRLGDGNTIRGTVRTQMARDSKDRSVNQNPMGCWKDENGVPQVNLYVNSFDPTTKSSTSWNFTPYTNRVVRVSHATGVHRPEVSPEVTTLREKISQMNQVPQREIKTEDLGTRNIAGVEAHGTRTTRTIPAGEEGNELPLITVQEAWRSKELGITLMAINDDPRRGKTTYEIEALTKGEPDEALFTPPAGYKVEDINPEAGSTEKLEGVGEGK